MGGDIEERHRPIEAGVRARWRWRSGVLFCMAAVVLLAASLGCALAFWSVRSFSRPEITGVPRPRGLFQLRWTALGDLPDSVQAGSYDYPRPVGNDDAIHDTFSLAAFHAMATQHNLWQSIFAFAPIGKAWYGPNQVAVKVAGHSGVAAGEMVSAKYFSGIDLLPAVGTLTAMGSNGDSNAVISYKLWRRWFAGSSHAIGAVLAVGGIPYTIVGVAPRGFEGLVIGSPADFWVPLSARPGLPYWGESNSVLPDRLWWGLCVVGRPRPGVGARELAAGEQSTFEGSLGAAPWRGSPRLIAVPASQGLDKTAAPIAQAFTGFAGAAIALLASCWIGLLALFVERGEAGRREISLRLALGCPPSRILLNGLVEAALISGAGCLAGCALGYIGARTLLAMAVASLSSLGLTAPAAPWHLTGIAVLIPAAFVVTMAPALFSLLHGRGFDPSLLLRTNANTRAERGRWSLRLRWTLIALQVAASFALACWALVSWRAVRQLEHASLGMETQGIYTFLAIDADSRQGPAELAGGYLRLQQMLYSIPGVEGVTSSLLLPGEQHGAMLPIQSVGPHVQKVAAHINLVGPGFFGLLKIPILAGRGIKSGDRAGAARVAVASQALAARLFGAENAIGRMFVDPGGGAPFTIVGIARDAMYESPLEQIRRRPVPALYLPYAQLPLLKGFVGMHYELRASAGLEPRVGAAVADYLRKFGPQFALSDGVFEDTVIANARARLMISANSAFVFAVTATMLLLCSLVATILYIGRRRRHEIAVRAALGATPVRLVAIILIELAPAVVIGVLLGATVTWRLTAWLQFSFEVNQGSVLASELVIGAALFATVLLATGLPAMVAGLRNPAETLREG